MIVFARDVIACRCRTEVANDDDDGASTASRLRVERATEADLATLSPEHHDEPHREEMRARLRRGDRWIVGRLEGQIVHYFWLSVRRECAYPSLPGCVFTLSDDTGYGYDAWTRPDLRGRGIRRRTFVKELSLLRWMGKRYEASFFVAYQLEGATRSLGLAGISIEPVWRITLERDRTLRFQRLLDRDETLRPSPHANGHIIAG